MSECLLGPQKRRTPSLSFFSPEELLFPARGFIIIIIILLTSVHEEEEEEHYLFDARDDDDDDGGDVEGRFSLRERLRVERDDDDDDDDEEDYSSF